MGCQGGHSDEGKQAGKNKNILQLTINQFRSLKENCKNACIHMQNRLFTLHDNLRSRFEVYSDSTILACQTLRMKSTQLFFSAFPRRHTAVTGVDWTQVNLNLDDYTAVSV